MSTRGKPTRHRVGVRRLREAGPLEERPGADVGGRQVDLRALIVDRIALDRRRALRPRIRDRPLEQPVRSPLAPAARAHAQTPDRPHRQVVYVRDLPGARKRQICARGDPGPADDVLTVVGVGVLVPESPRRRENQPGVGEPCAGRLRPRALPARGRARRSRVEGFFGPTITAMSSKRLVAAGSTLIAIGGIVARSRPSSRLIAWTVIPRSATRLPLASTTREGGA